MMRAGKPGRKGRVPMKDKVGREVTEGREAERASGWGGPGRA